MNTYTTLMRLTLLNRWAGFRRGSWRKPGGKLDVARIVATIMILIAMVFLAGFVIWLEIQLFDALVQMNQPMLLPAMALFAALVSALILGLFPAISALYFGRDASWLASLPLPATAVMAARWTELYLGDALINLGLIGPAALLYGLHMHADALYYLRSVAVILASPLLPLAVVTLLATLLVRVTGLARHKELFMMIGSLIAVAVVWGIEFSLLPRLESDGGLSLIMMLFSKDGIANFLIRSIPPVQWAAQGMRGDWLSLGLFLLVSAAAVVICLLLAGPNYLNLCMAQSEHAGKRKATRVKGRTWQTRSPLTALFLREWNELVKTPAYAMNAFAGVIIFPVMILAMYLSGMSPTSGASQMVFDELNSLLQGLSSLDITLIFAGCMAFPCFVNVAASTAVSREGGRLAISRMLPVPARTQLTAKLLTGLVINLISMASVVIVLGAIFSGFALWLVPAALLALATSYATAALSLTVDAIHPRLNWVNEMQAMKQNFNTVISMLLSMLLLGLDVAIPFFLLGAAPLTRMMAVVAAVLLECLLATLLMRFVAEKRYAALEG